MFYNGTVFGSTMKNLLQQRGSIASANTAFISRMGKSDHNLYRSCVESRAGNLDYVVQEVSDFSTSREDDDIIDQ